MKYFLISAEFLNLRDFSANICVQNSKINLFDQAMHLMTPLKLTSPEDEGHESGSHETGSQRLEFG